MLKPKVGPDGAVALWKNLGLNVAFESSFKLTWSSFTSTSQTSGETGLAGIKFNLNSNLLFEHGSKASGDRAFKSPVCIIC